MSSAVSGLVTVAQRRLKLPVRSGIFSGRSPSCQQGRFLFVCCSLPAGFRPALFSRPTPVCPQPPRLSEAFFYVLVEALVCVIFQRPRALLSLSNQLSNTIHPPRISHQPPQISSASAHIFSLNSINKLLTPSPHHTAAAEIKTCALCYLKPQHHFLLLHNRNDLYTCSHVPGTGAVGEVVQSSAAFLRVCGQPFPRRRSTGIPRFRLPGVRDVALDTDAHLPLGTRDGVLSPAS